MHRPRTTSARIRRPIFGAVLVLGSIAVLIAGAAPAVSAAVQPKGLDHFLCYAASTDPAGPQFQPPKPIRLVNQFAPNGFRAKVSPVPNGHCNPAEKVVMTAAGPVVTPITHPKAHLLCFPITAPVQPTNVVAVRNQFGRSKMVVGQPDSLCLPTWKNLKKPPPTAQPPGLDHFTCYPVDYAPGAKPFQPPNDVRVKDQFTPASAEPLQVQVGAPRQLCVPTTKIIPGAEFPPQHPDAHLLCFDVTQTPIMSPVNDQNQFGAAPVNITATKFLCLPTFKTVVPTG